MDKKVETKWHQQECELSGRHEYSARQCDGAVEHGKGGVLAQKPGSPFYRRSEFWGRFVLGLIFIAASVSKILYPAEFAETIHNYQLLPNALVNITAIILPWLELTLGILLILGVWLPGSIMAATALLVVFWASLVINLIRGLDVHCGCFSLSKEGAPPMLWYVLRDSGFLLLGLYLFLKVMFRPAVARS